MPKAIFYCEENGTTPLLDWLDRLPQKARILCIARVELPPLEIERALQRKQAFEADPGRHAHEET